MSSVEFLREFISERLDAAAERILARYERTVEEYEEKSERRRRQTDISWSPDQVQPPALGKVSLCSCSGRSGRKKVFWFSLKHKIAFLKNSYFFLYRSRKGLRVFF